MTRGGGRRSKPVQTALALDLPGAGRIGRAERAVNTAIRRGQRDGHLDTVLDAGMAALARTLARALDAAQAASKPWEIAAISRELRETLARLRLDPTARGTSDRDALADFLASLSTPEVADGGSDAGPATVGDAAQS